MFLALFFGFFALHVHAATDHTIPLNESELFSRVLEYNVGWDYVPYCSDDAFWDMHNNKCTGGTGADNTTDRVRDGYNIKNAAQLVQKVQEINVGWDWVPRCGDKARWNFTYKRCEGGTYVN